MTQFLNKSFSSRPASKEYRDNFDRTFKSAPEDDGMTPAPEGQIYVCGVCGRTSITRWVGRQMNHGWDESCMLHAVLCFKDKNADGSWRAVEGTK